MRILIYLLSIEGDLTSSPSPSRGRARRPGVREQLFSSLAYLDRHIPVVDGYEPHHRLVVELDPQRFIPARGEYVNNVLHGMEKIPWLNGGRSDRVTNAAMTNEELTVRVQVLEERLARLTGALIV
jgi:hypothetical protein